MINIFLINLNYISVLVLCTENTAGYKDAFKKFAQKKIGLNIQWLSRQEEDGKYLLLCNVITRIPEDVKWVLNQLDLDGKTACCS